MQMANIQARHIYLTSLFYCKVHGRPKIDVQWKKYLDLDDVVRHGKAAPGFLVIIYVSYLFKYFYLLNSFGN